MLAALLGAPAAHAVEAVNVRTDVTAIDLTGVAEFQKTDTDSISVSAAPGPDAIIRRRFEWPVIASVIVADQVTKLIVVLELGLH